MTISRILTHVTESAKKKQEKLENALEEITTNFFYRFDENYKPTLPRISVNQHRANIM